MTMTLTYNLSENSTISIFSDEIINSVNSLQELHKLFFNSELEIIDWRQEKTRIYFTFKSKTNQEKEFYNKVTGLFIALRPKFTFWQKVKRLFSLKY